MRIHYNIYITLSASLLAFTGCSNETDIANSNAGKHAIELSVGADVPQTRAVVTDGTDKTLNAFNSPTDIWMVMQSDYVALSGNNANPSDIDFKGSQTTTNCVTMGTTGDETSVGSKENIVTFNAENTRYWDDAHARSSALSIWAVAVPNKTGAVGSWGTTNAWGASPSKTIEWSVTPAQTGETVAAEDLCFSNNITKTSETRDKRLKYGTNTQYKFDSGKLIFYHALSKITIILKEGEGFNTSSTSDFNLNNITLKGFKLSGTFDVTQGEFSSTGEVTPITSMAQKEKTAADMTLEALVVPGTDLNGTLADAIAFSVDKSAFEVSAATLKEKLIDGGATSFDKFEAGKNYVFTFTVNKTGIKLTATIAGWDTVEGQNYAPKIKITEVYGQEKTETNNFGKGFSFYRSLTQADGYTKGSDVNYNSGDKTYSFVDQLYWPDHETHYFFRGIWPLVSDEGTPAAKVSTSTVAVENVPYSEGKYPSDLMLGYPRKADGSSDEICKISDHNNTPGICATEGEIRMNFQYVMSQVEVNLETVEGSSKVIFDDRTTVEIVGGYKEGAMSLENGSSLFTGKSIDLYTMTREGSTNVKYHDAIIPQTLGEMKFRITVTDTDGKKDKYETVLGIADIDMGEGTKISAWEPGKRYVYTLTITKTGIKVTATIKDWVTATGGTTIWM